MTQYPEADWIRTDNRLHGRRKRRIKVNPLAAMTNEQILEMVKLNNLCHDGRFTAPNVKTAVDFKIFEAVLSGGKPDRENWEPFGEEGAYELFDYSTLALCLYIEASRRTCEILGIEVPVAIWNRK
jgi:hypothetical protein